MGTTSIPSKTILPKTNGHSTNGKVLDAAPIARGTVTYETPSTQPQQLFDLIADRDHEQVVVCHDKRSGLRAIIGIHNTTLGPALGGCRMWTYASDFDALNDVLRLS